MSDTCTVGSMTSGHDNCAPVQVISGSPLISIQGQPVARVGDYCNPHGCKHHGTHTPIISTGSSIVFIEGIPVARVGDQVSNGGCPSGHVLVTGSNLVNIER